MREKLSFIFFRPIKSKYIFQISTIKKNNENKNRNNNIMVQHVGISVLIQ